MEGGPIGHRLLSVTSAGLLLLCCESEPQHEETPGISSPGEVETPTEEPRPPPHPVTLISISTGFNNPIGIDFHQPTNRLLMSVNYSAGFPYNFELVSSDGSREQFSDIQGLSEEVKIATVRASRCMGGFAAGEMFTGTGLPGEVTRIFPSGDPAYLPWITLPSESGLLRGSMYQDAQCVFGGDLIAVTTTGGVWRISSDQHVERIADLGVHLEGLVTVPDDADRYGPWASKILAGAEDVGCIYAIDADGGYECYDLGIAPEDIELIPAGQNFFGVSYGNKALVGAVAQDFEESVGDILMVQEFPGFMYNVRWSQKRGTFEVTLLTEVNQWEHVTFAPMGLLEVPDPIGKQMQPP